MDAWGWDRSTREKAKIGELRKNGHRGHRAGAGSWLARTVPRVARASLFAGTTLSPPPPPSQPLSPTHHHPRRRRRRRRGRHSTNQPLKQHCYSSDLDPGKTLLSSSLSVPPFSTKKEEKKATDKMHSVLRTSLKTAARGVAVTSVRPPISLFASPSRQHGRRERGRNEKPVVLARPVEHGSIERGHTASHG